MNSTDPKRPVRQAQTLTLGGVPPRVTQHTVAGRYLARPRELKASTSRSGRRRARATRPWSP